jgi:hypothetical protein
MELDFLSSKRIILIWYGLFELKIGNFLYLKISVKLKICNFDSRLSIFDPEFFKI